jgi:DNA repair photolyase
MTGSMSDPYMHLEAELRLTRSCLEALHKRGFGCSVLTKSERVLSDIDLLSRINEKSRCVVQTTLTTANEETCRLVEPNVSTTAGRVRILEACRQAGIETAVWLSPILPFIGDNERNVRELMDRCIASGVKAVVCFGIGMTLREGNREFFYQKLDEGFPGLKMDYIKAFGNRYSCTSPNNAKLMGMLEAGFGKAGVLFGSESVFAWLRNFEPKMRQASFFDEMPME